jgi:quercetin dioxygenase-like cupin family protein
MKGVKNTKVLGDFSNAGTDVTSGKMKTIYEDETNRFVFVNLKNGEKLNRHTSPYDLTVFVLSGEGNIGARTDLLVQTK